MDSILVADSRTVCPRSSIIPPAHFKNLPCILAYFSRPVFRMSVVAYTSASPCRRRQLSELRRKAAFSSFETAGTTNSVPPQEGMYVVGDFMTRKEDLHVVKPSNTVDEALEMLVEKRITGFPVIDDDWKLVGVVSDYDLLALDSISGGGQPDTSMFPDVDSTWKTFNEIQKLLSKTNGQVVGDLMTPAPLVVHENSNLEDAARLLLKTKYRRLPVVDSNGKLVGIITRGNVVRAALQIKRASGTL
ncbi:CBS domain-containing protein CBSX1, chloroplastic-like [Olea europaea var. sylvestris]|uniref:CBS domain-containing protein CBSX1, chloroplastic-like n=1 Tax=Olea europaea var. sylvestris TaxID=158386 RepID=UPI000C1D0315|nr:CBS domain-containing protein CBSX1, chloroplastic-like [Olea europaea var. sylvestris]